MLNIINIDQNNFSLSGTAGSGLKVYSKRGVVAKKCEPIYNELFSRVTIGDKTSQIVSKTPVSQVSLDSVVYDTAEELVEAFNEMINNIEATTTGEVTTTVEATTTLVVILAPSAVELVPDYAEIVINWTNNEESPTGTSIERSVNEVDWVEIDTVLGTTATYTDDDPTLETEITYYYRLRTYIGSNYSAYTVSLGANVNPLNTLIESLSPVFWIKDTLNVVAGKFVDESGNNKVLTASTVNMTNDTITLPASDAAIIAAVTAAGMYGFFYTNDTTPKAVAISAIRTDYSKYWHQARNNSSLVLFATALSNADKVTLDESRRLFQTVDRWTNNLIASQNFGLRTGQLIIDNAGATLTPFTLENGGDNTLTFSDNVLSFSKTHKTISVSITGAVTNEALFGVRTQKVSGKITLGFWVKKTTIPYSINIIGPRNSWLLGVVQFTLNRTKTDGTFTGIIDSVNGDWCHFTIKDTLYQNASTNKLLTDEIMSVNIYSASHSGNYTVELCDLVMYNSHDAFDITKDYGSAFPSKFNNKTLCVVGDSTGLGIWGQLTSGLLDFTNFKNASKSGGRISYGGTNSLWIPYYKETISGANADYYIIVEGGNDEGAPVGVIGGNDYTGYLDSYSYFIEYLQTNNPTAEIILCTFSKNTGGITNYEPTDTKAEFNEDYYHNPGIRELGTHYNLKVCDLATLKAYDYETMRFFLVDAAHYGYSQDMALANILAKFMNNNF